MPGRDVQRGDHTGAPARRLGQRLDRPQRAGDLGLRQLVVLEAVVQVVVVGGHVEVAVAGQVEQDHLLVAGLVGPLGRVDRALDGVRGLGRRDDALGAGERDRRGEHVVLAVGLGPHQAVAAAAGRRSAPRRGSAGRRRGCPAGTKSWPSVCIGDERRQLGGVAEVVGEVARA